ncbi:conserved hypothetical protein [Paecilomyces variotii No. 5]|uniref:GST C-terminal domain-containing protein n=1 Tax=Byssochlamys spectabilis (strain No. 5 / NBRC 109023) TaxID=1356009 RepID=V5G1T6_BYSSN|nr:conserved hypothetical protein [Paecilomyces variotii No. 5]
MSQREVDMGTDTRRCWDYEFVWTPNHLTAEKLDPLRYSFDTLSEDCLKPLNSLSQSSNDVVPEQSPVNNGPPSNTPSQGMKTGLWKNDLYTTLRDNHEKHEALGRLWKQVNTIPDWVDWEQISRGQEVYYRYGLSMTVALVFQSLLGGMGTGNVVETLSRTGGFSTKVVRRRLLETAQHTLHVTQSLESIRPGGAGHVSTIRVRLLHAVVRHQIMELAKKRPSYYNVEKHGIPINDLDSVGTIHSFSTIVIWIGLRRQGIYLSDREAADYIALWRLVAHYIGAPTDVFETPEKARATMESIMLSEVDPTPAGAVLAQNMIIGLENTPPLFASRGVLEAMARWLNGKSLSDKLGIGNPDILSWIVVCWVFLTFVPTLGRSMMIRLGNIPDDNPLVKIGNERLKRGLSALDTCLSSNDWLAGDEFTAADVMIVFSLTTMRYFYPYSLREYPGIGRYLQRIGRREAYQRAMRIGDPQLVPALGLDPPKSFGS